MFEHSVVTKSPALVPSLRVFAVLALCAGLTAQKTWIVDARGGGHFTNIQLAFDNAKDGDTVLVRGGFYRAASTNKGLTLVDEGTARIAGIRVQNLGAGKSFVMKGLSMTGTVSLWNNKGRVHLEDVSVIGFSGYSPFPGVDVSGSVYVTINSGSFVHLSPAVRVSKSTVHLVGVTAIGNSARFTPTGSQSAQPGVIAASSRVLVAGGLIAGGAGAYNFQSGPLAPAVGLAMNAGSVSVDGDFVTRVVAGSVPLFNTLSASAIDARAGTLRIAPTVTLQPSNTTRKVSGPVTPVFRGEPTLRASGRAPGGKIGTDAFGPAGSWSALFVSLPGPRVPLFFGELWMDPRFAFLLDVGRIASNGHRFVTVPIDKGFRPGTPLIFQAFNVSASARLSTPVTVILY